MKFLFLFCFIFFVTSVLKGQDTLIKRNGETIAIKLTEINPDNLKYKRFDYQDGPLFTISKEEVKLIIYQNGKKELFDTYIQPQRVTMIQAEDLSLMMGGKYFYYKERRITERDMLSIVYKLNDKGLNAMGRTIERLRLGQNIAALAAATLFVYGIYDYQSNMPRPARRGRGGGGPTVLTAANIQGQSTAKVLLLCGLASSVISITFKIDRRKHDRMIVDAYNKYIGKP